MEHTMIIDELRKELRHLKGRRDFYMGEVSRLKADYRKLQDENLRLQQEFACIVTAHRKEDQSDSQVQQMRRPT